MTATIDNSVKSKKEHCDEIMNAASNNYWGFGGISENKEEAFRLYMQAAGLGCPEAYYEIGSMYRTGANNIKDYNKALAYFKTGARLGFVLCYAGMYDLFKEIGQIDNARRCWDKFIDNCTDNDHGAAYRCYEYIRECIQENTEPLRAKDMLKYKKIMIASGEEILQRYLSYKEQGLNVDDDILLFKSVLTYLNRQ